MTEVQDTRKLIANTFLRPFRAVEGMADLYRKWATDGVQFHYVSSSPWQLYEPLAKFLSEAGFPSGTFHLKRFRLKDRSALSLLADPETTKPQAIEPLLTAFPGRQFILVGDSAEKDPEVYGRLAREYPRQIRAIFIRDVTGEPADSPRYARAFQGLPVDRWRLFQDATSLPVIDAFR